MPMFWTQSKFMDALARGDEKTVAAYLARDSRWAKARLSKKEGKSAIHLAVSGGNAAVVRQLLEAGASPQTYDKQQSTPLHYAVKAENEAVVRTLLDSGAGVCANSASNNRTPVQEAIASNNTGILRMLLDSKKVDLNAGKDPPLYYAVAQKSRECVETLLAAGADPNVPHQESRSYYDDYWPGRPDPEIYKRSPLDCACANGDLNTATMLLKAGAKALDKEYPLHTAVASGNTELAALLVSYGFDPSQKNAEGRTTLHCALMSQSAEGLEEMVQFLLAQGVNRSVKDKEGRIALSYAQQYAQKDIIDILQGPLPAVVPTRTVVRPVVTAKPPALEVAPPPTPMPAPSHVDEDDAWTLSGRTRIVHTTIFPSLGRRLTEIFNFETRERVTITENLTLKIEAMGPHESFDTVSDAALAKALGEFRRLGGQADETAVLGNRMMKIKAKL